MKKILSLFAALLLSSFCFAQLPDGSIAPDFTLYEINKTTGQMETDHTINLYSMLDEYKTVFIDVSASTCNPCYSFHQTGTLPSLMSMYGPTGTDDSRVLFIEGAPTGSSWASISGQNEGTWNVTAGANYPVIPLFITPNIPYANTFVHDYNISGYPTLFMVCPNRASYKLTRDGTNQAAAWHELAQNTCPDISKTNSAIIQAPFKPASAYFCSYDITPTITIQNVGTANMTSAVITMTHQGTTYTKNWTGNLAQFDTENVTLDGIAGSEGGNHDLTFAITEVNGVANEAPTMAASNVSFYVKINAEATSVDENFSSSSNLSNWVIDDNTEGSCFLYQGALVFEAYMIENGKTTELILPMLDLSANTTPWIQFDVAYRQYSYSNDRLQVMVSNDCGQSWTTVYNKAGAELKTGSPTNSEFEASSSNYRTDCAELTGLANHNPALVKFVFTSNYGNNIWLDNVKIRDVNPTEIESIENEELSVYPVPANDHLYINYSKTISQVEVYNVEGQLVKALENVGNSINISDLSSGIYMFNFTTEDGVVVRKVVKE